MPQCSINFLLINAVSLATSYNSDMLTRFSDRLDLELAASLTPTQVLLLATILSDTKSALQVTSDQVIQAELDMNSSLQETIEGSFKSTILTSETEKSIASSQDIAEAHEVFNAEVSLTFQEPIFSETKYTDPVNIQDVNYSLMEDYPHSYGFTDESGNWWRVNKKKSLIELVHNSGSFVHIDKGGNITLHNTGSFKHVVRGDYSLEVLGSRDTIIHKSNYTHVQEDSTTLVGANHFSTIKGADTKRVTGAVVYDYSSSLSFTIGGSKTLSVGGSASYTSSGPFKINGAVVKLN